ncbi:MAG: hypothetical protein RSC06_15025 [Clostridia bacterium]
MDEQKQTKNTECEWCHANAEGDYNMYQFVHTNDHQYKVTVSVCYGRLSIVIDRAGDARPQRISSSIAYCPFCGEPFGDVEGR